MVGRDLGDGHSRLPGRQPTPTAAPPRPAPNPNPNDEPAALSSGQRQDGHQSSSSSRAMTPRSTSEESFPDPSPHQANSRRPSAPHKTGESKSLSGNRDLNAVITGTRRNPNHKQPSVPNGRSGYKPPQPSSQLHMRADWSDYEDLTIRIKRVPPKATTSDIWRHLRPFGNIVWIDLPEDEREARVGIANVRFSPPPTRAFWQDPLTMTVQGQKVRVAINPLPRLPPRKINSPRGMVYPQRLSLEPTGLQFGVLAREDQFMAMREVRSDHKSAFSLAIDLKSKRIEMKFVCYLQDPRRGNPSIKHPSMVGSMEGNSQYKIQFLFAHIRKLVLIEEEDDLWSLLIPMVSAPLLLMKQDPGESHTANRSSWSESDAWIRAAEITYDSAWTKEDATSLRRNHQYVDIGRWTTYKLALDKSALATWDVMQNALQDFNIETDVTHRSKFSTVPAAVSSFWDIIEPNADTRAPNANLALLSGIEEVYLPYEVRYQLEVCISQGFLNEVNIDTGFLRKLADLSKGRSRHRDRARDILTYVSEPRIRARGEAPKIYEKRLYEPSTILNDKIALCHYPIIALPEYCAWVRKVVVTPSTMHLSAPTAEPSNRVLRKYASYIDRFMRVQFTDELVKGRLFPSPDSAQNNALFNRVFRTLMNGIQIGGRHFKFLAFGNSQFRENGAYFFSETDDLTCDQIRDWMGDVKSIRVVAKHAARLGQCFSTTKAPKGIPIGQSVKVIPDIEHNGWCFSDGVGKIAPTLAQYIARHLKLGKRNHPSAFQFRLGGSKGLLVAWPGVSFNNIELRPSQHKFTSDSKAIEIIQASQFSVATLNRQTISILSCLGVPDETFVDMLRNQLKDYDRALDDPAVAMRLLSRYVDQNGVTTMIAQMIMDGFMKTKEPFFMTILQVWRAWSLRLLRDKARIVVDKGAFVFGCVDETLTLRGHHEPTESEAGKDPKYPQIFLQVPMPGTSRMDADHPDNYTVITGLCVVGRNPSLHPGDIRVVEAVDVPDLRHLRDVVVFPATGDRDIPSMCSGGDLDGDDFFVIWDPELIPPERNYTPMIHETTKPNALDRDVRVMDLIQFFVTYMKNDSLSSIAHAHLARADFLFEGPKDPICVELAHLHSNAVDYPKSGQPAHLKRSLQPKKWPHFMEKSGKSYHSKNILGQLYDLTTKVDFTAKYDGTFDERILRRYRLDEDMLKKARIIKSAHDKALRQIMNQREIGSEFEVWTTFVVAKPRIGNDYKMQETMGAVVAGHRERFQDACIKVAGSREPEDLYPMVAAAYRITWEEVQAAIQQAQLDVVGERIAARKGARAADAMPLISFPWIFELELGRIARMEEELELDAKPEPDYGWYANDGEQQVDDGEEDDEAYNRLVGSGVDGAGKGKEVARDDEEGLKASSSFPADAESQAEVEAEVEGKVEMETEVEEEEEVIEDIVTGMDALKMLAD